MSAPSTNNNINNNSSIGNGKSFQRSVFIFVLGCFFGMQVLNFQVSHDGSLAVQHESHFSHSDNHHDAPALKTIGAENSDDASATATTSGTTNTITGSIPKDELKSLIRSELLELLQETKAELVSSTNTAATQTMVRRRQEITTNDNNVDEAKDDDDAVETAPKANPETAPKAAPAEPVPPAPATDDDSPDTTTTIAATATTATSTVINHGTIPKIPEPLVQPFTYTEEDRARNLQWKQLGRDWRLDDPEEKKVWDQLAAEQRTKWSDANGAPPQTYDKVALVSKVHSSSPFIGSVVQNMCLMKAAYNYDRNYPWIIFSTLPWKKKALERAKRWAYPANFTVVIDSEPLADVLDKMPKEEREQLESRCECCHKTNCCKDSSKLHWDWWCHEHGAGHATLSYLWQAEFRATHLWNHPALKDYKHMIWIDNDALPTKPWPRDPLTTMVDNDLVVMYDNFPQGSCGNSMLIEKMKMAYDNRAVCKLELTADGHFNSIPCKEDQNKLTRFGLIHGMFHITDLDVYRDPVNLEMNRLLTQHKGYKFSRQWDDQIAVTVVPAMVAPERAWDMRRNGFNMSMAHNGNLDGKEKNSRWSYTIWWKYFNHTWPLASRMCSDVMTFAG
ncbi:unnamed protein product [Cylindrotheca closterium]|uniref:Uncharacterized protein n=1 Tax=Cylindrotheca closterium TaxID=2856 RepID=A0AAD2FR71_9STRA|nr:unnamed protein product [Cylindrotheca closterium]